MKKMRDTLNNWNFKRIAVGYLVVAILAVFGGGALVRTTSLYQTAADIRTQIYQAEPGSGSSTIVVGGQEYEYEYGYGCRGPRGVRGSRHAQARQWAREAGPLVRANTTSTDRIKLAAVGLTAGLLFLSLRLLVALWVAQKAMKAGLSPLPWALAALVFHLFGILAFFIYRSFQNRCPSCGKVQRKDAVFCTECGHAMKLNCDHCGHEMKSTDQFCPNCGEHRA